MTDPQVLHVPGAGPLGLHATREHRCDGGTHTRLADGRQLCWVPAHPRPSRYAVDAELRATRIPASLRPRLPGGLGDGEALALWTRAEVCAKLFDVPILVWVTSLPWPGEGVIDHGGLVAEVRTHVLGDLVLSVGTIT